MLLGEEGEYNKLIRPVGNSSDTLIVKVGLRLSQIIDVVSHSLFTSGQQVSAVTSCGLFTVCSRSAVRL